MGSVVEDVDIKSAVLLHQQRALAKRSCQLCCLKSKYDRCGPRRECEDELRQYCSEFAEDIALHAVGVKMFRDAVEAGMMMASPAGRTRSLGSWP